MKVGVVNEPLFEVEPVLVVEITVVKVPEADELADVNVDVVAVLVVVPDAVVVPDPSIVKVLVEAVVLIDVP
jgi:hypothetical protein